MKNILNLLLLSTFSIIYGVFIASKYYGQEIETLNWTIGVNHSVNGALIYMLKDYTCTRSFTKK